MESSVFGSVPANILGQSALSCHVMQVSAKEEQVIKRAADRTFQVFPGVSFSFLISCKVYGLFEALSLSN